MIAWGSNTISTALRSGSAFGIHFLGKLTVTRSGWPGAAGAGEGSPALDRKAEFDFLALHRVAGGLQVLQIGDETVE